MILADQQVRVRRAAPLPVVLRRTRVWSRVNTKTVTVPFAATSVRVRGPRKRSHVDTRTIVAHAATRVRARRSATTRAVQFEQDMMHSDSHALATLLLLRDIQQDRYRQRQQRWSAAAGAGEHHDDEEAEGCRADEDDDGDARATRPESLSALSASGLQMQQAMRVKPACAQAMQAVCPTICEILDPRTQNTIRSNRSVAAASDFIQSNKFVAQILAMVCEDRGVRALLGELLGADGVSFSVRPSAKYAAPHEELSFFELQLRAQVCCRFRRLSFLSRAAAPRAQVCCRSVSRSLLATAEDGRRRGAHTHLMCMHLE